MSPVRVELKPLPGFQPQPGLIGLTQIQGDVGKAIEFLQGLNGDGFSRWEHAVVLLPGNQILEAEPGGAVIRPLHYDDVYWCWNIYGLLPQVQAIRNVPGASEALSASFYLQLWTVARQLEGTPYSFLDYASLIAHRLHVPAPGLRDYIKDTGHQICSQLADDFYLRLGGHVFTNQRWAGDVTPGSLWRRDLELAGT